MPLLCPQCKSWLVIDYATPSTFCEVCLWNSDEGYNPYKHCEIQKPSVETSD